VRYLGTGHNCWIGRSLRVEDFVEDDARAVSVGKRTGRVLKLTAKRSTSGPSLGCASCKEQFQHIQKWAETQKAIGAPVSTPWTANRVVAEVFYIARPLVHLLAAWRWGLQAWKPWLLALTVELFSLLRLRTVPTAELNEAERAERLRRYQAVFLYVQRCKPLDSVREARVSFRTLSGANHGPLHEMLDLAGCSALVVFSTPAVIEHVRVFQTAELATGQSSREICRCLTGCWALAFALAESLSHLCFAVTLGSVSRHGCICHFARRATGICDADARRGNALF
jgi:hypothetical protein